MVDLHLKNFTSNELILNEVETKEILRFIFPHMKNGIARLKVNDDIRSFAQALLVEAIDASYELGFFDALFSSMITPTSSVLGILKNFAFKAGKHWFKHATTSDLINIEIAYIIRQQLQLHFSRVLADKFEPIRIKF